MSVTDIVSPTLRGWSGSADPRLPVAIWTASTVVTGDASGGSREGIVEFKAANTLPVARLFNLEQFDVFDNHNGGLRGDLLWNAWDLLPGRTSEGSGVHATVGIQVQLGVSTIAGSPIAPDSSALGASLPILLGVPAAFVSQTTLQFRVDNINGVLIRMRFQGYVWSNRSFQTPGGPQRPQGALWQ